MQCTRLKADYLEEAEQTQAELQVSSAAPTSLRAVAVPLAVRWREFRIQVLPFLAFGGALGLALILWQKAVVPLPAIAPIDPPASLGEDRDTATALSVPAMHQASHGTTNGIARAPTLRD